MRNIVLKHLPIRFFAVAVIAVATLALAGCATTSDDDSDMPWNTPEAWEGSPYIPGFSGQ